MQRPDETLGAVELEKLCAKALNIVVEIDEVQAEEEFFDALTGQRLRADMVRAARRGELEYFAMKKVWTRCLGEKPCGGRANRRSP